MGTLGRSFANRGLLSFLQSCFASSTRVCAQLGLTCLSESCRTRMTMCVHSVHSVLQTRRQVNLQLLRRDTDEASA